MHWYLLRNFIFWKLCFEIINFEVERMKTWFFFHFFGSSNNFPKNSSEKMIWIALSKPFMDLKLVTGYQSLLCMLEKRRENNLFLHVKFTVPFIDVLTCLSEKLSSAVDSCSCSVVFGCYSLEKWWMLEKETVSTAGRCRSCLLQILRQFKYF